MKYYDSMGFESPDGIWARRADVVDIEYSIKLQRLIENLKYDTETPYPELHHHKMIVAAKTRIRELEEDAKHLSSERDSLGGRILELEKALADSERLRLRIIKSNADRIEQLEAALRWAIEWVPNPAECSPEPSAEIQRTIYEFGDAKHG